ncbi:MAG: DUF3341 domain-containing protein [Candidatus Palauibacterales bacterium]|nr:DUF3341 domain-containing protein [Candidatus Palauibacterales bacterium]MDP2529213.1 DUF3341 domain-containing protein [Candidatus Palauibacterales bacterium]MDP2583666.1 DUF3341 domain-containing protein [Candidatus Palauibacterales bacterium]
MADAANVSGVLAHYESIDGTRRAIETLREAGFDDLEVFSPVMCPELEEALGIYSSPVRRWALIGGITGFTTANLLTIGTSLAYPLIGQGKPIISWPPFIVIMFELTILYTGLFAMFSWMVHAHRPKLKLSPAYRAVFSVDRWGIFVPVDARDRDRALEKVRETEAVEVEA